MECTVRQIGNVALMKRDKIGFLSSRKMPPAAVMKCDDWATRMRDEGRCVIGGFQSPLEKDVLSLLLKGRQPIIWVLARKLWSPCGVPKVYRPAIDEGRLLVVSPVAQTVRRVDERSSAIRNRYILEHSRQVVFAALDPDGELARLLARVRPLEWQRL